MEGILVVGRSTNNNTLGLNSNTSNILNNILHSSISYILLLSTCMGTL